MTEFPQPQATDRAADRAAAHIEQIVEAAEQAADAIRAEVRAEAVQEAESELNQARKQAIMLGQDARRESERLVEDARREAQQVREQTRRTVDGRVAAAEKSAAEVLAEARALSGGLRQLGKALEDHADRILRDVTAAHKRMQSDLRVDLDEPAGRSPARPADPRSVPEPSRPSNRPGAGGRDDHPLDVNRPPRRERPNPIADLEVPSWVAGDE